MGQRTARGEFFLPRVLTVLIEEEEVNMLMQEICISLYFSPLM